MARTSYTWPCMVLTAAGQLQHTITYVGLTRVQCRSKAIERMMYIRIRLNCSWLDSCTLINELAWSRHWPRLMAMCCCVNDNTLQLLYLSSTTFSSDLQRLKPRLGLCDVSCIGWISSLLANWQINSIYCFESSLKEDGYKRTDRC